MDDPLEFAKTAAEIHSFITALHIREKSKSASEIYLCLKALKDCNVPLSKMYVNDRADIALAAGAKGVQLTYQSLDVALVKSSFPGLRIGKSVHSIEEALEAERQGADYLIYGHIFPTASKQGLNARGLQSLNEITKAVSIPVVAIGGITPERTKDVLAAGASGIAVMSGIWAAASPIEAAEQFYTKVRKEGE
ncbi:thiazole tautomerase TenI [Fictibacillus gelatini]|uniref:thiazole tautomerase TenI n=1 Tax=Fictibacillus gelatini TaxID=225985 RepID=UPI002ADE2A82|nr:thiazole tautomerase TenI [Fictibacillus gelatini]